MYRCGAVPALAVSAVHGTVVHAWMGGGRRGGTAVAYSMWTALQR